MWSYFYNVGLALDILANALLGGGCMETLTYRYAKWREDGHVVGCVMCRLLEWIDPHHCRKAKRWYRDRGFK